MRHWISPCSFAICTPNISDISAFIFIDTNWLLLLYSVILFPSSLRSSCTRHWISDRSFTICAQNVRHKWYIYSAVWLLNRWVQFTASSARKHIRTQTHKKFRLSVYPSVCYVYVNRVYTACSFSVPSTNKNLTLQQYPLLTPWVCDPQMVWECTRMCVCVCVHTCVVRMNMKRALRCHIHISSLCNMPVHTHT